MEENPVDAMASAFGGGVDRRPAAFLRRISPREDESPGVLVGATPAAASPPPALSLAEISVDNSDGRRRVGCLVDKVVPDFLSVFLVLPRGLTMSADIDRAAPMFALPSSFVKDSEGILPFVLGFLRPFRRSPLRPASTVAPDGSDEVCRSRSVGAVSVVVVVFVFALAAAACNTTGGGDAVLRSNRWSRTRTLKSPVIADRTISPNERLPGLALRELAPEVPGGRLASLFRGGVISTPSLSVEVDSIVAALSSTCPLPSAVHAGVLCRGVPEALDLPSLVAIPNTESSVGSRLAGGRVSRGDASPPRPVEPPPRLVSGKRSTERAEDRATGPPLGPFGIILRCSSRAASPAPVSVRRPRLAEVLP